MANTRHIKAGSFVQQKLFAGVTVFAELESRIASLPEEKSRGDAFEVFAEAYLATQRKHDAAQVWPHGSVPLDTLKQLGLTESDQGVDGVLKTLLGEFDAYQVKFRTNRPALTWRELSTFIGLADSPRIHSRVLLTSKPRNSISTSTAIDTSRIIRSGRTLCSPQTALPSLA